jgi:zinc protease
MVFEIIVPPEQLPLALWVTAERMGRMPHALDPKILDRERNVVLSERALTLLDRPYGQVDRVVWATLFPHPHPLHAMVIGTPKDLASVTVADAKTYAERYLTPANGILTIVGNFENDTPRNGLRRC